MRRVVLALLTLCAFRLFSSGALAQDAPANQLPPAPSSALAPIAPAARLAPGQIDPRVLAWHQELAMLELELERLRPRRPRLFWPIALVGVGGIMAVSGGLVAVMSWAMSRERRYGWDEDGNRYEYTSIDQVARSDVADAVIVTTVGLAIAGGGLALLIPRVRARRERSARVRALRTRHEELMRAVRYSLTIHDRRGGVAASVQF